jgi:predicted dehydrogenase
MTLALLCRSELFIIDAINQGFKYTAEDHIRMIEIGLIGAGKAAEAHVSEVVNFNDMTIDAVASRSGPSGFIEEFGLSARSYKDPTRLCNSNGLDAVIICTPTYLHSDHITTAIENELHILCEKPIVRKSGELSELTNKINNVESVFMPAHITRYMQPYIQLRERILQGEIGDIHSITARRLSTFPDWGSQDWFSDYNKSGGVFLDMAIHDLDFVNWTVGKIDRINASKFSNNHAEHGIILARSTNDVKINIEASWAQPHTRPFTMEFEAVGSEGSIQYRQRHSEFKQGLNSSNNDSSEDVIKIWNEYNNEIINLSDHNAWRSQLEEFRDSIHGHTTPRTSIGESLQAIKIANSANKSVKTNECESIE